MDAPGSARHRAGTAPSPEPRIRAGRAAPAKARGPWAVHQGGPSQEQAGAAFACGVVESRRFSLLEGPPGFGKTTTASWIAGALRQDGWLVGRTELRAAVSAETLVAEVARAVFEGILVPAVASWQGVVGQIAELGGPQVTVDGLGGVRFEFNRLSEPRARGLLQAAIAVAGRTLASAAKPGLLILDEVSEAEAILDGALDAMMTASDRVPVVRLLGVGAAADLKGLPLASEAGRELWGAPTTLGPLSNEVVGARLTERARVLGAGLSPGTIGTLCAWVEGHPRAVGTLEAAVAVPEPARRVPMISPTTVWGRALSSAQGHHMAIWRGLPVPMKSLLLALSADGRAIYSSAYRERHGLGSSSSVQKALIGLHRRGLVWQRSGQEWAVVDPLLRDFVRSFAGGAQGSRAIRCG